jgi:TolB-like protein
VAKTGPERKLAAILAADVVGYSRQMAVDEVGTLARLRVLREEVIDPLVAEHHGRLFKTMGDGFLVEFASVVQALQCAIAIQASAAKGYASTQLRIGVHQGDIVVDDDDLLGDGINIAARLEGLAEPGGICISSRVREDAAGKMTLNVTDLGTPALKNIDRPVHVFRVDIDALERPALPLPDRPSIAVLPFQNMSGDPEQEYFADGMVEEITTAIARLPWLFVISRNSSFTYKGRIVDAKQVARDLGVRYVLEGSVRKAANRVRITGQLIDATTGAHIWANRFDGELADIFDLQDEVTTGVVAAIEPKLRDAEIERAQRKPTSNLLAYDLLLRALPGLYTLESGGIARAIATLDQAITLDPNYARALALKARLQVRQVFTIGADSCLASSDDTARLARLAVEKDRDDPEVLWMAGFAVALAGADLLGAVALVNRSLRLNPNCAEALAHAAMICAYTGDRVATISHADRALRLNPMGRAVYNIYFARSVLDFVGGDYEGCLDWTEKSLQEMPRFAPALRYRAASLSLLGRHDEARHVACRLGRLIPTENVAGLQSQYRLWQAGGILDALLDGLRQAGLPKTDLS